MATIKQRLQYKWNMLRYSGRALWASVTGQKAFPLTFPIWREGRPIQSLIDFQTYVDEGYNRNELVFACITLVASNAATAPLKAWTIEDGNPVPIDHQLVDLLQRPNPRQSRYEFQEMIDIYLNLEGNAFVIKLPDELWLARPDRIRPVITKNELAGFVYLTEGQRRIPFLPNEIVHIKMPNPGDPYEGLGRGLPPLAAAALATDIDNRATGFLKSFFDNAAVPFGLLKSKNIMDDEEIARIRERLRDQYAGETKWHEMMILDADADYQKLGADISEIAWPELRGVTEVRICMAFKVPPIMVGARVGLERSTYSNTEQAEKFLWRQKIVPDNERIASGFTTAYTDDLPEGVYLAHDYSEIEALQESRTEKFNRANQGAVGGWMTVNDARAEVGLIPVRGGDVFLRPLMTQEVEAPVMKRLTKGRKLYDFEEVGGRFHKVFDRIARAWEGRFESTARERFEEDHRELLALLGKKRRKQAETFEEFSRAMGEYVDVQSKKKWMDAFLALFGGLMLEQAELWVETLGVEVWNFDNPEVQAFIADYAFQFADRLGNVTKETLRGLVSQGQAEGWSINKLRDELTGVYSGWDKVRAHMIAQTETIRSSNAGAVEAYNQAGVEQKQWFTAEDGRVCGFCFEMHGKIVGTRDVFWNRGDVMTVEVPDKTKGTATMTFGYEDVGYPPLHPNCLIGKTSILAPDKIAGFVASYSGPIIELTLSDSRRLSITPNHMLLTMNGFARAASLRESDKILYCPDFERIVGSNPDNYGKPFMIQEIIQALAETPGMFTRRVPVSSEYLHGDAALMNGYIDVISSYGFLGGHSHAIIPEMIGQKSFGITNTNSSFLSSDGNLASMLLALSLAADGNIGIRRESLAFSGRHSGHSDFVGFASASNSNVGLEQPQAYCVSGNPEAFGKRKLGFASQIAINDSRLIEHRSISTHLNSSLPKSAQHNSIRDASLFSQILRGFSSKITEAEIVNIRYYDFSGHVYDLHTQSSLYIANGVISSNCRCTLLPVVEELI